MLIAEQPRADLTENRAACAAAVLSDTALAESADRSGSDESADNDRKGHSLLELDPKLPHSLTQTLRSAPEDPPTKDKNAGRRFGLPPGFVTRPVRYGRSMLFEDNVYRLPNGTEFIPQFPAGTLGFRNHQYALLTVEQYLQRQRGSVYVRTDGRIFDYAHDHNDVEREMFDTGFTIHDLERTGRYAPELKSGSSGLRKRGKKQRPRRK